MTKTTNLPPLAERIRPRSINEFIGQSGIIHDQSLLLQSIRRKTPFSLIFWGPPGTGKTTLARILSTEYGSEYLELSAVSSGVADIRKSLAKASEYKKMDKQTILFIDEIHRFSKSQQDALLHAVEDGTIILFGATTENPSFEVIAPLLSRCRVIKLLAFEESDLKRILQRALETDILFSSRKIILSEKISNMLTQTSGGDARKMLNTLELAISFHDENEVNLTENDLSEALQQKHVIYDRAGDYHYDIISAFIKSVRGSDPDAALYWLAIMLEGGEKPEFISRRLIILASEDIGNADPYAVMLANSCFQSVHTIGMPESAIILGQLTTYLAGAPKSNAAYKGIKAAQGYIQENGAESVPLHLRNSPTKLMKNMGYGKNYHYPHDQDNHFVNENYFPDKLNKKPSFYIPSDQGREKFLRDRLRYLWKDRF
ncbi:MAG: replication-associated recombination protein A [Candidatus Marinimicrobia bacterium]|jgi:putative ATPase|nr:replication-associated recombination protein A [Candidatus Neomarinimicrobiota bacterium]MBT3632943.1 replication-associated recombination protein A [Candidatus Neomarinimicrobiota bacterium]MBT3682053.1 replication-associated recombination protein A [Candidatus Neomarinimicrobiota bacterium]MBT3758918.1 replication-associated recombination protein A [Candidatus Neomarinimicrobiota bacterium]MBT3895183.1 replication-associated recombination protein A [Candidatus Neomarinimicrobiota bacterium